MVNNDVRACADGAAAAASAARLTGGELTAQEFAGHHAGNGASNFFLLSVIFVAKR